jgi:hypothetical protein
MRSAQRQSHSHNKSPDCTLPQRIPCQQTSCATWLLGLGLQSRRCQNRSRGLTAALRLGRRLEQHVDNTPQRALCSSRCQPRSRGRCRAVEQQQCLRHRLPIDRNQRQMSHSLTHRHHENSIAREFASTSGRRLWRHAQAIRQRSSHSPAHQCRACDTLPAEHTWIDCRAPSPPSTIERPRRRCAKRFSRSIRQFRESSRRWHRLLPT